MYACTLRRASAEDAGLIFRLYAAARSEELAAAGWTAPQLDAFLRLQMAARDAHYRACFPAADHWIVQRDGRDAGRLLVDRSGDGIHLIDLALLQEDRGHGLGSLLLRELQAEAADSQRPLQLHVEIHNRARSLYRRLGFVETGCHGLHVAMRWAAPAPAIATRALRLHRPLAAVPKPRPPASTTGDPA